MVVSVEEKAYRRCQVWITKVSAERTHARIEKFSAGVKIGVATLLQEQSRGNLLLPRWHPVSSWHERDPGSVAERGNSVCDAKRKPSKCDPRKGKVSMRIQGADHPVGVMKCVYCAWSEGDEPVQGKASSTGYPGGTSLFLRRLEAMRS